MNFISSSAWPLLGVVHYNYAQFIDPHYDGIQIQIYQNKNDKFIKFPVRINKFYPLTEFDPGIFPVASRRADHWAMTT